MQDMGHKVGFVVSDVSAWSMQAGGGMSLLLARVDADMIQLIGQWHSNEMLQYLHVTTRPIMNDFAAQMVLHGDYTLIPPPWDPT